MPWAQLITAAATLTAALGAVLLTQRHQLRMRDRDGVDERVREQRSAVADVLVQGYRWLDFARRLAEQLETLATTKDRHELRQLVLEPASEEHRVMARAVIVASLMLENGQLRSALEKVADAHAEWGETPEALLAGLNGDRIGHSGHWTASRRVTVMSDRLEELKAVAETVFTGAQRHREHPPTGVAPLRSTSADAPH